MKKISLPKIGIRPVHAIAWAAIVTSVSKVSYDLHAYETPAIY